MTTPIITTGNPPPLPPPVAAAPRPSARSPWLALLLNFMFPGAGQLYNGQIAKGFTFFFAFVGSIYGCVEGDPMPFALFLPFIFVFSMIDAWRSALALPVDEPATVESPVWGGSLLGIGLLLLLNNLGWLPLAAMRRAWPLFLIALGALFLWRSMKAATTQASSSPAPSASPFSSPSATDTLVAPIASEASPLSSFSEPADDERR